MVDISPSVIKYFGLEFVNPYRSTIFHSCCRRWVTGPVFHSTSHVRTERNDAFYVSGYRVLFVQGRVSLQARESLVL